MLVETAPREWLTTAQAARVLVLTPCRVRQLLADGTLRHTRTPLGRLVDPASVEELRLKRLFCRPMAPTAA